MSNSAGGLIVWPARLMVPAGFLLLIVQALSELIKRIGFLGGCAPFPARDNAPVTKKNWRRRSRRKGITEAAMTEFLIANMAPIIFRVDDRLPARRFPGRFRAGRQRHRLRPCRHRTGPAAAATLPGAARRIYGVMSNETLLAVPFFTFMV